MKWNMKYLVAMYQTIAGAHQIGSACHVIHIDLQSSTTVCRQHTVCRYILLPKTSVTSFTYKRNKSWPSILPWITLVCMCRYWEHAWLTQVQSSSSHMRVIYHSWSATKQRPHPQSVAEISRHSVLSGDRIRQCETSSRSRHKDTDQCL